MKSSRTKSSKPSTAKSVQAKASEGKVRILGGRWRRRTLPVADAEGLRPTGNRIRETLFNWLMPYLHQARCLDLYAGTGALGLEALSRGAAFVQFIESHAPTHQALKQNLLTLDADKTEYVLTHNDALRVLSDLQNSDSKNSDQNSTLFDLVFLDPPFQENLWQKSMDLLASSPAISNDALIYVERPRETKINTPSIWREHRSLNAGKINATLYVLDKS